MLPVAKQVTCGLGQAEGYFAVFCGLRENGLVSVSIVPSKGQNLLEFAVKCTQHARKRGNCKLACVL